MDPIGIVGVAFSAAHVLGNVKENETLKTASLVPAVISTGLITSSAVISLGCVNVISNVSVPFLGIGIFLLSKGLVLFANHTTNKTFKTIANFIDDHIGDILQIVTAAAAIAILASGSSGVGLAAAALSLSVVYFMIKGIHCYCKIDNPSPKKEKELPKPQFKPPLPRPEKPRYTSLWQHQKEWDERQQTKQRIALIDPGCGAFPPISLAQAESLRKDFERT